MTFTLIFTMWHAHQSLTKYLDITDDHVDAIQMKIMHIDAWDVTIPLTLVYLFERFMTGAGRRTDTNIDQLYMEYLYKIPISLIPAAPNITKTLERYSTIASQDIDVLVVEETALFRQSVDRANQTIASLPHSNTTFVRETLGNLTVEFSERCNTNYQRLTAIYEVHADFANFQFNQNEEDILALAVTQVRFRFVEFPAIQPKIVAGVDELRMRGNATFETLLERAWFVATSELFMGMAQLKADIMMEMDRFNEIVAPGKVFAVEQRIRIDRMEDLVKETMEKLNSRAQQFSVFEQKFMAEAKRVHALNATLAAAIYDAAKVREPQWAYIVAGLHMNQDMQKIYDEFYAV